MLFEQLSHVELTCLMPQLAFECTSYAPKQPQHRSTESVEAGVDPNDARLRDGWRMKANEVGI